MTAKEKVLSVYPDAIAEEINKGSRRLPTRWIIYSQSNDRILTEHAKGSEENAWKSAERAARQNAAESLPAQVQPHDFIACIECDRSPEHCGLEWCGAPKNHPSHNSHVPVAPVDLCICGLSKSLAKDRLWLHHSSCSLHEPKPTPSSLETRLQRQRTIGNWCVAAFGEQEATSMPQRGIRLFEEAGEAAQVTGVTAEMAHAMVDYVWRRPVGVLSQELGGVGVTMLALAEAALLDADECEAIEVQRVLGKPVEHFTKRNQAKNDAGFLVKPQPDSSSISTEPDLVERIAVYVESESECLMQIVPEETKRDYGVRLLKVMADEIRDKFAAKGQSNGR